MISERSNDGLERTAETWFKRYNGKAPERGGARKCPTSSKEWLKSTREAWAEHANRALARAGSTERIDHRSLSDRAEEAREAGDLERAAELSREPGRHLGPGAAIEAKFWQGEGGESVVSAGGGRRDRGAQRRMGEPVGVDEPGVEPGARGARPDAGGLAGCGAGHPGDG